MTIQRQYSLPNCTLTLEGLSDATTTLSELRPSLSILMSAECSFAGHAEPLTGGRDFFESLVRVVSSYAQEFMSGVPSPHHQNGASGLVQLHKIDGNLHRLTVQSPESGNESSASKAKLPLQFDLTTVQLFDLVEAIDQFFADSQTLPDLSLKLAPVAKRDAQSAEPVAKRALPAAVGVSSLALAAMAFFLIPIPDVQRPKDPVPQPNVSEGNLVKPTSSGAGTPPVPSPEVTPTEVPSSNPTPTPSATVSPLSTEDLKTSETVAPKISDPAVIEQLSGKLYEQINQVWKIAPGFNKELVYRVSVAQDGAIVGYKAITAEQADDRLTPLPELLYKPVGTRPPAESLADFRVVFTPGGVLQVSPW